MRRGGAEGRLEKILFSLVREYIKTRKPVSSKRILEVTDLDWSGATIRNDMKKLEEMGYLHQPHTSAGRVPTDRGLRFYLNELMKMRRDWRRSSVGVDISPNFPIGDLNTILEVVVGLLSRFGRGLAVATKPDMRSLRIMGIHTTRINDEFVVVSAITELGMSSVVPMRLGKAFDTSVFDRFFEAFSGRTFDEVFESLEETDFPSELEEIVTNLRTIFRMLISGERIVFRGISELLENSGGQDLSGIIRMVETGEMIGVFEESARNGVEVFIGVENPIEELKQFSTFVAPYRKGKDRIGITILITPKFVEYERVYQLVEYVSNRLTEYLTVASRR